MATIIVGPYTVDATKCNHSANPPVCRCIHDWRIAGPVGSKNLDGSAPEFWGNVERTGHSQSDGQ